jgi:pilus assembly protein TadC
MVHSILFLIGLVAALVVGGVLGSAWWVSLPVALLWSVAHFLGFNMALAGKSVLGEDIND